MFHAAFGSENDLTTSSIEKKCRVNWSPVKSDRAQHRRTFLESQHRELSQSDGKAGAPPTRPDVLVKALFPRIHTITGRSPQLLFADYHADQLLCASLLSLIPR